MNNNRDTFSELRQKIDGSDPFMTGGHQIMKTRTEMDREVPAWAKNDAEVQKVLLRSFPKLGANPKQRARAARWARVIHMYFRVQMTHSEIAAELKVPRKTINYLVLRITRAARGESTDGRGPRRKLGRPKKSQAVSGTSFRGEQRPSGTLSPSQVQGAGASPLFSKDSIDADVQSPSLLPSRARRTSAGEMSLPGAD